MRFDDLDGLHTLAQQLGGSAPVALEAEFHVRGREGVAVVKLEALPQLELVREAIWTLAPRFRQAGRHVIPGQRLDQRVVQGVQERERSGDPWGLGRIEERRGDRSVEGDSQLAVRLALRTDLGARRRQDEEQRESNPSYEVTHLEPPDASAGASPIVMDPPAYRRRGCSNAHPRAP